MSENYTTQLLADFFRKGRSRQYNDGDLVYESSNPNPSVFYLESGYAKSYMITDEGNINVMSLYGPNYIFPLIPTFRSQLGRGSGGYHARGTIYYETISPSVIYSRSAKDLFTFSDRNHDVYKELSISLLNNSEIYLSRIGAMHYKLARDKLIYQLLLLANLFPSQTAQAKSPKVVIDIPLTHQDIGDILGLARETISREMEKLKKSGLISSDDSHHIVITDINELSDLLTN